MLFSLISLGYSGAAHDVRRPQELVHEVAVRGRQEQPVAVGRGHHGRGAVLRAHGYIGSSTRAAPGVDELSAALSDASTKHHPLPS